MAQAKQGDTVKVHYTGTLTDGTPFDSSLSRDPIEFKLGTGQVIRGFDEAIEGMAPGDSKTVKIPSEQAYGDRHDEAIREFPRSDIPQDIELELGMRLQANDPSGQPIALTVVAIEENTVTLDANHPLAGQDLIFELELVEVI